MSVSRSNARRNLVTRRSTAGGHPFAPLAVCAAFCLAAISLFSCATGPHTFTADPLAYLGEDAAWYGVVPVAANLPILEALSRRMEDGDAFMENLDRATMLYLAGTGNTTGGDRQEFPFRLVATGSFPPKMARVAFPSRKGWEKIDSEDGAWYRNGSLAAAIPRPGLLFFGKSEILPAMLRNVAQPAEIPVREEFRALVPRSGTGDGTIALYVRSGDAVRDRLLGDVPFSLPVTDLLVTIGTATKIVEKPYIITIRLYMPDQRTTRAMLPLIRLVFSSVVRQDGTSLVLELPADAEDIAEFLDFLYL